MSAEENVFEIKTQHRTFRIIVDDKFFYVNPSFLAERSTFFQSLLFGDYQEKAAETATLKDVNADGFEEFLMVLGADPLRKKHVNPNNFPTVFHLAHLWVIETLRNECIAYIEKDYMLETVSVQIALDVAVACDSNDAGPWILRKVVSKLALFDYEDLVKNDAHNELSGAASAATFLASKKNSDRGVHCKNPVIQQTTRSECMFLGCQINDQIFSCPTCSAIFCKLHNKGGCKTKLLQLSCQKMTKYLFTDFLDLTENLDDLFAEDEPDSPPES